MEIINEQINTPKGFKAAGEFVGIKKAKKDMGIIYSEKPAICSAVFTKNVVKAAPLQLAMNTLKKNRMISAIAINSGNANACTGEKGYEDAKATAAALAEELNLSPDAVLVSSTGVIGKFLNTEVMRTGVIKTAKKLADDEQSGRNCAEAIMTTDTFVKVTAVEIKIEDVSVKVAGIAKGSGMIHPNMATMLGFLTTDVNISEEMLDKAFKSCIENSFNMITVDGEMSTNDTCLILANGSAGNIQITTEDENYNKFREAVDYVCKYLARQIVLDGEGATKFLEVNVKGASSEKDARVLCKSILNSNLVKTAFFGKDANWGRILSAMGASGVEFNPKNAVISFRNEVGEITLYENGLPTGFDEDFALKILSERSINIDIQLKEGTGEITGYGCDLSYDYVKINADYRT